MEQDETTPTKFVETPVAETSVGAPAEVPAPVATAPVEVAPVVASSITAAPISHVSIGQELEADVAKLFHKLRQLGIDFEVFLRGAKQRHDPQA